jgi:integrase
VDQLKRRRWLGGYVRQAKTGPVFIIERMVGGTPFHVSTRCRTERAALKELERFETAPHAYRAGAPQKKAGASIVLTAELIRDYVDWQEHVKKTTRDHALDCERYLGQWADVFGHRDLRTVSLHDDIKPALDEWKTARKTRVVALKGLTAWLRREKGVLERRDDPTLDLQVPSIRPEKLSRRKAIPFEVVQETLPKLPAEVRDLVVLLAATGLHVSEVRRFATGEGALHEPSPAQKKEGVKATLSVRHKNGRLHVVALTSDEVLQAAQAIALAKKVASHSTQWWALREAGASWNIGSLRHSVATWLHEAGWSLEAIAEQLGHRDPRTTADFYRDMGFTAKALPIPHLRIVKR